MWMNIDLTESQVDRVFSEKLRDLTGDYRISEKGQPQDASWCGDPSCGGHYETILNTEENKLRLAAIALVQAISDDLAKKRKK